MGEEYSTCGKMRNSYKIVVGKSEKKRLLWIHLCNGSIILKWIYT